jgi:2-keto-4-pentenoate hydratase/2-oxohepta-3-ene-1,7-dioic acid hydratase in catechol pathway
MGAQTRIGAFDSDGRIVDLAAAYRARLVSSGLTAEAATRISAALLPGDMVAFIEGAERALDTAREALAWAAEAGAEPGDAPLVADPDRVTMLAPVPRPPLLRDFMGFETHLRNIYPRLGREIPPVWYELPVYYKGNTGSVATHEDDVPIPSYATELDFEFELALIIGKGGRDIARENALAHVFGYTIYNDFSARAIQTREMSVGLGPAKGKDFWRGHVLGPWLVTADEVGDIYDARMVARVNGKTWCDTRVGTIHWRFEDMIAHASLDEYLRPGEVFGSGTVGDGSAMERGTALHAGDVVELEVEGLGLLRNRVVSGAP